MSETKEPPRWVTAAPDWVTDEGVNVEVVPAKYFDALRRALADAIFREMNGLKPVVITDSAQRREQSLSNRPPACPADPGVP